MKFETGDYMTIANEITIEVYQQDWMPGFAAFVENGELNNGAKAHVLLNIGGILSMVETKDIAVSELPYMIAECLMHEVIHVLEDWAGVEFNEERVEALLDKYREKYKGGD